MTNLPLPQNASITDNTVDSLLTINAVSGHLIYLIDEFERLHKAQFRFEIKKRGNFFREELLRIVNQVWITDMDFDSAEVGEQQMVTYIAAEKFFQMALEVSRLDEKQREKFNFSFQNLLYSFKLNTDIVNLNA